METVNESLSSEKQLEDVMSEYITQLQWILKGLKKNGTGEEVGVGEIFIEL